MVSIIESLHDGAISCMTSTETGKILVTGGADSVRYLLFLFLLNFQYIYFFFIGCISI